MPDDTQHTDTDLAEEIAQILKCAYCNTVIRNTSDAVICWIDKLRTDRTPSAVILHNNNHSGRYCHENGEDKPSSWMPADTLFLAAFSAEIADLPYPQQLGHWAIQVVNDGVPADQVFKIVTEILASGAWISKEGGE